MTTPWYQRGYRRLLVDMHIPDWDERFLSRYDPTQMADIYADAGLSSVMIYGQSHVGLCYWPTRTGRMHAGLRGRDVLGELLRELKARGIDACVYYSVIYNNWAFLEQPEWRIVPSCDVSDGSFAGHRYGHCCPNNPGYRAFVMSQIDELVGDYDLQGLYADMTFWPAICLCEHCRARLRNETGSEIPELVNWTSPEWCSFQAARERWMCEFTGAISSRAKFVRPSVSVNHNFATAMFNWTLGLSFGVTDYHDYLGADFYGDPLEQLVVSKLMSNLTPNRPLEFETSLCVNLRDHVRLKSPELLEMQALAATVFSSAFMFIDAINIDGTLNSAAHGGFKDVYEKTAVYEPFLGGEPVEDIAVYFSDDSKMDFAEDKTSIHSAPMWRNDYPHLAAVRGVCRLLQQAHVPFGVITRKQLGELSKYKCVLLPNVLRMDVDEVEAVRGYVEQGGRIYASRYTSLTETRGVRHEDFMLSDVFGCSCGGDDLGQIKYVRPTDARLAASIAPQEYISHFPLTGNLGVSAVSHTGMLRLAREPRGLVLATLTLPYASLEAGTVFDQNWASIHGSPPWEDTDLPVIVENSLGRGTAIYSSADIECVESCANDKLFIGLIRRLTGREFTYSAQAHPAVWMNAFHQPDKKRFVVGFLNYQRHTPAVPVRDICFTLRPPAGTQFHSLKVIPCESPMDFAVNGDGTMEARLAELDVMEMLLAEYH